MKTHSAFPKEKIQENDLKQTVIRNIYGDASRVYYAHGPCDLFFTSIHPDDPKKFYTFSFISPDLNIDSRSLSFEEARRSVFHPGLHKHDFFELVYVSKGSLYQNIENKRHLYPEGSLCLLNRNVYHQEEYGTEYSVCFLALSPKFISGILTDTQNYILPEESVYRNALTHFFTNTFRDDSVANLEYYDFIPVVLEEKEEMSRLFDELTRIFSFHGAGTTYRIKEIIMRIFRHLYDNKAYQTVPVKIGSETESLLFNRISACMQETNGRISRSELQNRLHYSGSYLNRIVLKYSGLNIFGYSMLYCMNKAAELLTDSDLSIVQITEVLGFQNRTHFYSKFKSIYGLLPGEYRKLHK